MRAKFLPLLAILALLLAACADNTVSPANTPGTEGQATATPTGAAGAGTVQATPGVQGTPERAPSPARPTPGADETAPPDATAGAAGQATGTAGPAKKLKIALFVSGTLGDKSFWDSSKAGVDRAERELGAEVRIVEEPTKSNWEPTLRQLAEGDYDIIVTGGFEMVDILNTIAPQYRQTKFILFDATVDQPNVANIIYAQNEASFLAGALAACVVSNSDLPNLTGEKVIGAVGGMNIDVINDFLVGYEQGAKYVDPEIEVRRAYAGTWEDPAKGKELAAAQLVDGANVVFNVAGKTGLGVLEAAADAERYSIGVDANQNNLYPGSVLSSVLKRVDNSVFDLIQMEATGSLRTGKTYPYGIQNNGVGLAEDELYRKHVPQQCRDQVDKAKRDIATGKVEVRTAFK